MKFRALMRNQEDMREFLNTILALSKLTKECIMKISPRCIYFILDDDSGNTAHLVWVEMWTNENFSEYVMEGVNETHQFIYLSLNPSNLAQAIALLRNDAKYCKIKLTNEQYPCLTIELEVKSSVSDCYRQVVHHVPISIIPRVDWGNVPLTETPNTDIFFMLSSDRTIRGLVDKLKNISPTITFYASNKGEMNVVAETELLTVTARYKGLKVTNIKASEKNCIQSLETSCTIDCKKMVLFFSSLQSSCLEWSCGISEKSSIHFQIVLKTGLTIHSIIPAVCYY